MGSVVAPATAAPFLEGWLIDNHDWTWIFFMVLPLSLDAAGLLIVADPTPARPPPPPRLDWIGPGAFGAALRAEEPTAELQSLIRNSYAAFCLSTITLQQTNSYVTQ